MLPSRSFESVSLTRALITEGRPKQWAKNVLVFAPAGTAGVLLASNRMSTAVWTFVAFCLISSGTYFVNDLLDLAADRRHPRKRFRPIAAGLIPLPVAVISAAVLMIAGISLAMVAANANTALVLAAYIVLSLSYSKVLKHIAIVDIFAIAAGFVLRAVAGASAVDVPISEWFFIVVSFCALTLVTGKRRAEMMEESQVDSDGQLRALSGRATLDVYTLGFLNLLLGLCVGGAVVSYALWAVNRAAEIGATHHWHVLSVAPFAAAVLQYVLRLEGGGGGAPEDLIFSDRTLQIAGVLWAVVVCLAVYSS
jgi:decaprenyl-phosphate phosphoribosyltransferase